MDLMDATINIKDIYGFPGFRAGIRAKLHPLDPCGVIITLNRRQKKRPAVVAAVQYAGIATADYTKLGTWMPQPGTSTWNLNTAGSGAPGAKP